MNGETVMEPEVNGSEEIVPNDPDPTLVRKSEEEKREILDKIDDLRKQGMNIRDASEKVGIHFGSYYTWRKELNKKQGKEKVKKWTREEKERLVRNFNNRTVSALEWHENSGLAEGMIYRWRRELAKAPIEQAVEVKPMSKAINEELKQAKIENQRLRVIVSDLMLERQALLEYAGRK